MRLIVLSLVVLLGRAYAGDEDAAALTARIHELKAALGEAEKRIANADNDDVRAQAKRQAEELRGAIERTARELKAAQRPEGAREKPVQKPEAREGGGLEKMVDHVAALRKRALAAKREGRVDQARDLWLEAERLDQALKREIGEGPPPPREGSPPPREGPPRDAPPPEALVRALNAAHKALESRRWEAAEEAFKHAVEILAGMVRRPEIGPEDAKWCRGQVEKLMGGAAAFREADRMDMAEFLEGAAEKLLRVLEERMGRPVERRPAGADLEQRLRELAEEHGNLGRRIEELEGARRELAQDVERREDAVREAEGEKREALKRELQAVLEKLERVTAEINEIRAHAEKIGAERAQVAAELRNVRREGDRERPRAENPELMQRVRELRGAMAENTAVAEKLRAQIREIERKAGAAEGERREGLRRELAALREQLADRERNIQELSREQAELASAVDRPVRRGREVERERPDDARAEIEALRAEVRELRRLLQEALKRD